MGFSLLPKEYEFFDMFDKLAEQCINVSKQFRANVDNENFNDEFLQRVKDIEHAADSITFEIFEKLNKTFITPFDSRTCMSSCNGAWNCFWRLEDCKNTGAKSSQVKTCRWVLCGIRRCKYSLHFHSFRNSG